MADFKKAIEKISLSEGGYANDLNDSGGETYKGVSRKNWPNWIGWNLIDASVYKTNAALNAIAGLQDLVVSFYKVNFWDKIGGDLIVSQPIANLLMDSAVNEGITPAVKRAQEIVGLPQTGKITNELVQKLNTLK